MGAWIRKNGATIGIEVLVNFALPYAIYVAANRRFGDVDALIASSAPPLVWSLAQFLRNRRVDAVSVLVLAGIVLSLLAFLGGGSVRFLQIRENLVGALIGIVFLGSAAIGRPLVYELAVASLRRNASLEAASFEALRTDRYFRGSMMVMTLVWGVGLIAAAALCCALLFVVSIATYLLVSPAISYGAMGVLAAWTFWYAKRRRKIGEARRAARARAR